MAKARDQVARHPDCLGAPTAVRVRYRRSWRMGRAGQSRPYTLSAYGETSRWLSTVATPGAAAAAALAAAASCSECTCP